MKDKELIRQEIERRIDLYSIAEKDDSIFARMGELSSLMNFIDSLPEENHFEDKSEMVSEETTIVNDWQYGKDPDHAIIPAIHQRIEGFNIGDKVKIIIVKPEQQ